MASAGDILYLERLKIRDNFSLPILVGICEILLKCFESDFAVFIKSIPEIDPETLDPDNRNCPVCWSDFNLPSKYDPATQPERDLTPLRLPCAHHVCNACIHDWLPKAGICPVCRQQFGPENGKYPTVDHEKWFRLREPYEVIAEITPIYLAGNPINDTFGEFAFWLYAGESDDFDSLKARAQWAMDRFQGYTISLIEAMRLDPIGRQWLHKIRVGIAGRAPWKDSGNGDEVGSDEGGVMEESLDTLDDTDLVSEGYSSNGEEDGSMDDDEEDEGMDENEAADTAAAPVGEEEDLMDENEDADTAAAAVGDEEDFTDEDEDSDEMSDDEDDGEYESELDEQHTFVTVLGCAALVSLVGMGIMMGL